MDYDASKRLAEHVTRLLRSGGSQSDTVDVLRKARLVLEQDASRDQYPDLSIYCDWLQHTALDEKSNACLVLERIDRCVVDLGGTEQGTAILCGKISCAMGLPALRNDLIRLFRAKGIPTDIFESFDNWKQFLLYVLDDLSHRPLGFPADVELKPKTKMYLIFKRMIDYRISAGRRADFCMRRLYITNHSNEPEKPGRPRGMYWNLQGALDAQGTYHVELNGVIELEPPTKFTNHNS